MVTQTRGGIMAEDWNDKKFAKWIDLRKKHRQAKKEKDYSKIVSLSLDIIALDKTAKFIGIFLPIFTKDIAEAYLKLGKKEEAIRYFNDAIAGFQEYRKTNKLSKSDDFLNDIAILEKKIQKVQI
jgi:tetratricopeptide (TPR) repeat protein